MIQIREDDKRRGLYWVRFEGREKPATASIAEGVIVYGEQTLKVGDKEYRVWDPYRSKLSAALIQGLSAFAFEPGTSVLYLGAASGTTASHVSDLVGEKGIVYCVDFAPRSMRDLIRVCESRHNMIPILADAQHPERYIQVPQLVDVIYQDVAQPNQAEILVANAIRFLKEGGTAYLAVKARSVDVAEDPEQIFKREEMILQDCGFTIVERVSLEPFAADHILISAIFGST